MIKKMDGDRFEAMRSLNQKLTFEITKNACKIILPNINAKYGEGDCLEWVRLL